jgi:hypothetical protein
MQSVSLKDELMKRMLLLFCLLLVVGREARGESVMDYSSLIDNLHGAGVMVKPAGEVVQPFFSVNGKVIKVLGEDVQVFQYMHETEMEAQAAQVAPNGSTVGTTQIQWIGAPHFYKKGTILVLYAGDNNKLLKALKDVLGQQFAGK